MTTETGRRERKKAATRTAIADAALRLFLERGFDAVSIRDIAEQADVAVATVFAHFSGKEALVFDEEAQVAASLLAAVEGRPAGTDVLGALERWFLASRLADPRRRRDPEFVAFRALVDGTPQLLGSWRATWRAQTPALADAMTRAGGPTAPDARLLAALVVEGYLLAATDSDPRAMLRRLFRRLRDGWAQGV